MTTAVQAGPAVPDELYIAGSWRPASRRDRIDIVNPATEAVIASVADVAPEDALSAVEAAADSLGRWSTTSPRARSEVLSRAFALMGAA